MPDIDKVYQIIFTIVIYSVGFQGKYNPKQWLRHYKNMGPNFVWEVVIKQRYVVHFNFKNCYMFETECYVA